jgi:argininosuccinate lyase
MLKVARQRLNADEAWLAEQRSKLAKANVALNKAFAELLPFEKLP